ncbi:hypothetical protein LguiA_015851 [Lonicera macranthoides]
MSEDMNLSVNGQSQVPPGFRFHPTEEELLHYYLRKKVAFEKIDLDVIRDVDLNKLEPWDIQERCRIGSTPQNDWYFFSHKDKKYPTGTRTNRATAAGFWKATGRDKVIYSSSRRIGMRKTLVFYKGRAPHGQKSDWIMHEYRLDDNSSTHVDNTASNLVGDSMTEEGWVVCRVFKKKNYHKALESPQTSSTSMEHHPRNPLLHNHTKPGGVLDQILHYMGRSCKQELEPNATYPITSTFGDEIQTRFMQLPRLESPTMPSSFYHAQSMDEIFTENNIVNEPKNGLSDWVTYDRLVASQLNGQVETVNDPNDDFCFSIDNHEESPQMPQQHFDKSNHINASQVYSGDMDLWSYAQSSSPSSSSDPLCHLSV